jgi:hypothetical protein
MTPSSRASVCSRVNDNAETLARAPIPVRHAAVLPSVKVQCLRACTRDLISLLPILRSLPANPGEVVGVQLDDVYGVRHPVRARLSLAAYLLLAAVVRFGRRTALTVPLLPPPQ